MAKANSKATKPTKKKLMNTNFNQIHTTLKEVADSSEEIMPLFSAALRLAIRILGEYQKAFNVGTKYVK